MPAPAIPSPSLEIDPAIHAFELKFLLPAAVAADVQRWAADRLTLDPHGDPALDGQYRTTTLYLDTPARDVYQRSPGFARRKYRVRRYGEEPLLWVERKIRRDDRVRKRREPIGASELERLARPGADLPDRAHWFRDEIGRRGMAPAALLEYRRTAYVGLGAEGPLRLTLDRGVRGALASRFLVPTLEEGLALFQGEVICELKFRAALPPLFRQLVADFGLSPASVSKYRTLMSAATKNGAAGSAATKNGAAESAAPRDVAP